MERFGHTIKMTWMGYWRFGFIIPVALGRFLAFELGLLVTFFLSLGFSIYLVYFRNWTIEAFPLWKLVRHQKSPMRYLGEKKFRKVRYSKKQLNSVVKPEGYIDSASKPGNMSGYEPSRLANIELTAHPNMLGTPGSGLGDSGFSQKHIDLGVQGELNFAKVLQHENMLSRFGTAWSTSIPNRLYTYTNNYTGDLDCLIVTGGAVYLIDLKNYASGDVTYYASGNDIYAVDNATNKYLAKGTQRMSKNMAIFQERYRQRYPQLEIRPYIVLMPTDKGEPTIHPNTRFPGDIPVVTLSQLIEQLRKEPSYVASGPRKTLFEEAYRLLRFSIPKAGTSKPKGKVEPGDLIEF